MNKIRMRSEIKKLANNFKSDTTYEEIKSWFESGNMRFKPMELQHDYIEKIVEKLNQMNEDID